MIIDSKSYPVKTKRTFLLIALVFLVVSCGKKESFPLKIVNNTGYDLSLTFSGIVSGDPISLDDNTESETLLVSYEKRLRLTPKLICLSLIHI